MTKHNPVTPLPWKSFEHSVFGPDAKQGHDSDESSFRDRVSITSTPADAGYIAHCANAYPKLVEALAAMRDTFMTGDECRERAITLLRELREEE